MKSKTSKSVIRDNYSSEIFRLVIITLLIAATLIAVVYALLTFKQMLIG